MDNLIAKKLSNWAIRIWERDDTVIDELRRFFPDMRVNDEGVALIKNHGMLVAISQGLDPINSLAQLGFAFFGPLWAQLPFMEQAFKMTEKAWKERTKKKAGGKAS